MPNHIESHNLKYSPALADFVEHEILPGLNISSDHFWSSLSKIFYGFKDENKALLDLRESLQAQIDDWHKANEEFSFDEYKAFLKSIDYLVDEGPDFSISTSKVDEEISTIAASDDTPAPMMIISYIFGVVNGSEAEGGKEVAFLYLLAFILLLKYTTEGLQDVFAK